MSIYEYNEEKHMRQIRGEGREEGRKEGRKEGNDQVNRLIQLLAESNRMDDIVKAAYDKEYQKKLFMEFGI